MLVHCIGLLSSGRSTAYQFTDDLRSKRLASRFKSDDLRLFAVVNYQKQRDGMWVVALRFI